jgi:hypothetical protein
MKSFAKMALICGILLMVVGVLLASPLTAGDPRLPVPLAICGAGMFIGGAIIAKL